MLNEGRVQTTDLAASDGMIAAARLGKTLAYLTQDAHARYQDAVRRGNVFVACMQAIGALSVNSATATGLIVTNPAGSGKNLVFLELLVALASAPAGVSVLALVGSKGPAAAVTHTTPMTTGFTNALLGGGNATSVALVDTAATIPTPATFRAVPGGPAATGSVGTPFIKDEIAGALVMAPGTVLSLQAFTTAISVIASLAWEEVPVI
jgi:hypothetical protein